MIELAAATEHVECGILDRVIGVFHRCFAQAENVRLEGGHNEPQYFPGRTARIGFREDFVNSALHEIAHWCIAGPARRQLPDYGYWYAGDARDLDAQRRFEAAECRPQALECLLATACGLSFRTSLDNFAIADYDSFPFRLAVWQRLRVMQSEAIDPRADMLLVALASAFGQSTNWRAWPVELSQIG